MNSFRNSYLLAILLTIYSISTFGQGQKLQIVNKNEFDSTISLKRNIQYLTLKYYDSSITLSGLLLKIPNKESITYLDVDLRLYNLSTTSIGNLDQVLMQFTNLEMLCIEGCDLSLFNLNYFANCNKLTYVRFIKTKIENDSILYYIGFQNNIRYIILDENYIKELVLKDGAYRNLREIHIESNNLELLDFKLFTLPEIKGIYLANNNIKQINTNYSLKDQFNKRIDVIDLTGNHFFGKKEYCFFKSNFPYSNVYKNYQK